jgi:hypothetical protein
MQLCIMLSKRLGRLFEFRIFQLHFLKIIVGLLEMFQIIFVSVQIFQNLFHFIKKQ